MLTKVKYKGLIAIESLLEGNSDEIILRKIIKALPVFYLKRNIGFIYEKITDKFQNQYNMDLFNNFEI